MRTEQNYLQKAQEMTFMLDVEEQAAKVASSLWQADDAETRLTNLRHEAETMLKEWQASLKIIDNEIYKVSKQRENICYIDSRYFLFAWGEKKITEKEYFLRKEQQGKIETILKGLQETQDALLEAIAYLHEYLYPSQEWNASQPADLLPFASNWGAVAQTPKGTPQTPQALAMQVLTAVLEREGMTMKGEYLRLVRGEMSDEWYFKESFGHFDAWELLDNAMDRIVSGGSILDVAGQEELYRQFREYPEMSQDFRVIVEAMKDYFLYYS